jgi:hypothetical protein
VRYSQLNEAAVDSLMDLSKGHGTSMTKPRIFHDYRPGWVRPQRAYRSVRLRRRLATIPLLPRNMLSPVLLD